MSKKNKKTVRGRTTDKFGKLPINARISIDYSSKNPKIKFGYPGKKEQERKMSSFNGLIFIILLFVYVIGFILSYFPFLNENSYSPGECKILENVVRGEIKSWTFLCNESLPTTLFYHSTGSLFYSVPEITQESAHKSFFFVYKFGGLFSVFFLTYLLSKILPKSKTYQKLNSRIYPEVGRLLSSPKYSKIFKNCTSDKIIEIPLFKNVFMDYRATKEFAKYLEKVEIKEHDFNCFTKKNRRLIKGPNYYLWKARFYFKEVPSLGELEVRWH